VSDGFLSYVSATEDVHPALIRQEPLECAGSKVAPGDCPAGVPRAAPFPIEGGRSSSCR